MLKQLYLLSESTLKDYIKSSADLKAMAVGMSALDVKENIEYIFAQTSINEIPEDGQVKLDIDQNGIAHIPIVGTLTNNVTPSAAFFGESITTYHFISESVRLAELNPQVKEIFFEINSGGGHVGGVEQAAESISNSTKKTTAIVHSMAASGAYWLASQADSIIATGRTSTLGSIGVVTEFVDRSKQDEKEGVKRIVLTSTDAPNKRIDITTSKGQDVVIDRLDEIHSVFVDQIANGRSVSVDFINKNFGSGGVMAADRALKNKMIDGIGFNSQAAEPVSKIQANAQSSTTNNPKKEDKSMDLQQYLAENPTAQKEVDSLVTEAVTKNTEKIQAKINKVIPYIGNENYKGIEAICTKVLKNETDVSALEGAVSAFDMMKEQTATAAAAKETEEIGDTAADDNTISADGIVRNEQDMDAIVAKTKQSIEG